MCHIRGGGGAGVGNWFEDNICQVVGDGKNTFFWRIFGLAEFLYEPNFVDFLT